MNSTRPGLAWLILLLSLGPALADGAKRITTKTEATHPQVVTGSLIPDHTRVASPRPNLTRPTGPVLILTSAGIQRIGARDLADALRRGTALAR